MSDFVYVNQDGTIRELSCDEREYLAKAYAPTDSGRPFIKASYKSEDGWGSISGFISRRQVPPGVTIQQVNPDYREATFNAEEEIIALHMTVRDTVTRNADGSIKCVPEPKVSRQERFERARQLQLEKQAAREFLAKHPDCR